MPHHSIAAGLLSLLMLLAGCADRLKGSSAPVVSPAPKPTATITHQPHWPVLVGGYQAQRLSGDYAGYPALITFIEQMEVRHGFPKSYLLGVFSMARRKQWTLDYMAKEAPSSRPAQVLAPRSGSWNRYRGQFLTPTHISRGVNFWNRHATTLKQASLRYGVPEAIIMGILGVETAYGANLGQDRILDALTTLAFDYPRRAEYFTGELENFLLMTRSEGMDPTQPKGSFAGAMGLGQFMPGSFLKWAQDFDGDGRRDLWNPADAIASIAHYFTVHDWQSGEPVVVRAKTSGERYKTLEYGYDRAYSLPQLATYGIEPESMLPVNASHGLPEARFRFLRLGMDKGEEHWLGLHNFYVITRYNHSTHYAMAVYQLGAAVQQRYQHALLQH